MADHIVAVPPYFLFILIAQIVLAVVVLGLAAYGCTFNDFFGGNGYAIFCAIATFIINGYYIASTLMFQAAYNCWAFLILACLMVIWWLSCWANLAAWAAAYNYVGLGSDCHFNDNLDYVCNKSYKNYRDAMGAAAGVGALIWILTVASLIIFGIRIHRHRKSGAPYTASSGWRVTQQNPRGGVNAAEAGFAPQQKQ